MKLLLAVDGSGCAQAAVEAVMKHFRRIGTEVRVVHVLDWPKELPSSLAFGEGRGAAHAVLHAEDIARQDAHLLLARVVDRLTRGGYTATAHLVEGGPRQAITTMAKDWPADVVVVGSHGRHGLDRLLLGSVSESVVRQAQCSVFVVREGAHAAATGVPIPKNEVGVDIVATGPGNLRSTGGGQVETAGFSGIRERVGVAAGNPAAIGRT
ncbi:MAG TPA: universal stress protein [Vicinamibacterales bacterium]|jgi:nucleotide-binding universal stress UspA family protein